MRRTIYDLDSAFYLVQSSLVDQLNALIEDKDPKRIEQLSGIINPQKLYSHMIELVKALYVHTLLKKKLENSIRRDKVSGRYLRLLENTLKRDKFEIDLEDLEENRINGPVE